MISFYLKQFGLQVFTVVISILFSSCICSNFSEITAEKFVSREGIAIHRDNHFKLRIGKRRNEWYLLGNIVRYNTNNRTYFSFHKMLKPYKPARANRTYDKIHETVPGILGFKIDNKLITQFSKNNFERLTPVEQSAILSPLLKESSHPEQWVYLDKTDDILEITTPFRWRIINTKTSGHHSFWAKPAEIVVFATADIPATVAANLVLPPLTLFGLMSGIGW